MADNIQIPSSTATGAKTIAADDVGGVLFQVLKLAFGADGAAQFVDATHGLPVADSAVATALAALQTELGQKLEGADLAALATAARQDAAKAVLDSILTELGQKLEAGGEVALSAATLAALERVVAEDPPLDPLGYVQASVTTAVALPNIPVGATSAVLVPRAAIRYRDDGVAPTASAGMFLDADQPLGYSVDLAAFRMIAVTGSVEVNISYYGQVA